MTSPETTEAIDRIAESYSSKELLRPVLQVIPFGVGSAIDSFLGTRGAKIQIERINQLLKLLKKNLEDLDEEKIDKDFLENDEFYFFCRDIFKNVANERSRKKIEYFSNVFTRGILKTRSKLDVISLYLEILDELLEVEILFLNNFHHLFEQWNKNYVPIRKLLTIDIGLSSNAPNDRFLDHLEQHHLVDLKEDLETNIETASYAITKFGREFIEAISEIGKKQG